MVMAMTMAEDMIRIDPMIDGNSGVVSKKILSLASAKSMDVYVMLVALLLFSYDRPAASRNC